MSGRRMYIYNQVLARNAARDSIGNYKEALRNGFSIEVDDGTGTGNTRTISQNSYDDPTDQKLLYQEWMGQTGLNSVNHLDSKFLNQHFWPTVEKNEATYFSQNDREWLQKEEEIRKDGHTTSLISANSGQELADTFNEIIDGNFQDYGASKKLAREALIDVLEQQVVKGELPQEVLLEFYNHTVDARDGSGKKTIAELFDIDVEERTRSMNAGLSDAKKEDDNDLRKSYDTKLDQAAKENGGRLSELQLKEFEQEWNRNPETRGLKLPDRYTYHAANSVEDGVDDDTIALLQQQWDNKDTALSQTLVNRINDGTLRKEWQEKLDSPFGQANRYAKGAQTLIGKWSAEKLGVEYGEEGQGSEWYLLKERALTSYRAHIKDGRGNFATIAENHQHAMDLVEKEIARGLHKRETRVGTTGTAMRIKSNLSQIIKNPEIINDGLLSGTQTEFKKLQQFAKKPATTQIPQYYYTLANRLNLRDSRGVKIDGYALANAQYRSQTGKDLPKIGARENIIKKLDKYKSMKDLFNHPAKPTKQRAIIEVEEDSNYNAKPEYVFGGVMVS